jgi:hypothetical protein
MNMRVATISPYSGDPSMAVVGVIDTVARIIGEGRLTERRPVATATRPPSSEPFERNSRGASIDLRGAAPARQVVQIDRSQLHADPRGFRDVGHARVQVRPRETEEIAGLDHNP